MEDFYDAWDTPTEDFFDTYSDSLYTTTTLKNPDQKPAAPPQPKRDSSEQHSPRLIVSTHSSKNSNRGCYLLGCTAISTPPYKNYTPMV